MTKNNQSNSVEATFDAVSEWADVIGFLTRLSKALSTSSQFQIIPHKFLIAKRLAQCLNPALPSGVHQKTLEVYSIIFQTIGLEELSKDLSIYSYGLFPLLQYSAMNVKPQLLNLYEKILFTTWRNLKQCMKSFILALLPGFEDEGNEYYEQTYNLMDKLCGIVGEEYFYHCLFLGIISSTSQRIYAFSYILKKFKKPTSAEEMKNIFKGNLVICSRCIAASLLDDDLLVQRSALELLVSYLPVNYEPFSNEDLDIVLSSAITVVLRKDMSLNRRLYSWLLGIVNEGSKPHLSDYIKTSICRSIKLINTVNMFLSMIEPYIIWSNIFHNLEKHHPKDENDNKEIYQLFEFLLSFIKITDEEAETIHLPFCFYLMIKQLNEIDDYEKYKDNILIYMKLILTILKKISKNTFRFTESKINELKTTPVGVYITSNKFNEYSFINDYYKMQMSNIIDSFNNRLSANNVNKSNNEDVSIDNPEYMSSIVENATIDHCSYVAHCSCQTYEYDENSKYVLKEKPFKSQYFDHWKLDLYSDFYSLIFELSESTIIPFKLEFVPIEYDYIFRFKNNENEMAVFQSYDTYGKKVYGKIVSTQDDGKIPNWIILLKECCISVNNFHIINSSLLLLFDVISKKNIVIKEIISDYNFIVKLIEQLWNYLSDKCVSYNIQTVKLILELCKYVPSTYMIENLFSVYLNISNNKQQNYNKFGVFWKTAETMINPSTLFSQPLFILFDTLFSNSPQEKQLGEQWFKNYVKDISVCFDPLLQILHNSLISRKKEELVYESSKVINYKYMKEINFDQISYAFDCIMSLINNIPSPLVKKLWKTPLKLVHLLNKCESLSQDYDYDITSITYGEFITLTCLLFIQSETPSNFSENYKTKNESIQLQSGKLLLHILSFIPRENQELNTYISIIQEIILKKLLFCEVLETAKNVYDDQVNEKMLDISYTFLHTILDALSFNSNRPLLLYWIEFILSCIQTLQISFFVFIQPIIQCLCDELENYLISIKNIANIFKYQKDISEDEFRTIKEGLYNDNDAQIVLYGLERLFKYCLTDSIDDSEEIAFSYGGLKSFSNYVSSIFTTNNIEEIKVDENSKTKIQEWLLGNLPKIISVFQQIWSIIDDIVELKKEKENDLMMESSFYDNVPISEFLYTGEKYKNMIKKYLNSMYRINYIYVVESLIEVWLLERIDNDKPSNSNNTTNTIFQMIDCIDDCSPTVVIQTIIQNLRKRRHQKNKIKILKILLTTIIEKLFKTDMFEDRGLRRDQQEIYQRILDICIAQCQKIFESPSWVNSLNNQESINNSNASNYILVPPSTVENNKISVQKDEMGYIEIIMYISKGVFPIIRKVFADQEKIVNVCNNINYYIITNVFKNRNEETLVLVVVLDLIIEMLKLSYTHRCYKKEIWDLFYNPKFFRMNLKISSKWKVIMNSIVQSDTEKFNDLISRIALGSPTNIFISREQELANRALILRRLSYIIFSGENDQYLKQLPIIQEKIVELFKESNNYTNIEVYLFLRVLLRRISTKHLANFWPVIFTELFNLFEKYIDVTGNDEKEYTNEELKLLLSSFKFLELLIVLAPQEFQLHQWIFIGETNETINDDNITSELAKLSLMDKLKYIWMKNSDNEENEESMVNINNTEQSPKKLLITVKNISNKTQIKDFVCHISKYIYDSTLRLSSVDTEFIDKIIESDLLENDN
ncbi:hypothetical protein LY90DRAFT_509196 [Neocallimastix californiae]|uniref:Uncharacterized protein n=1 Tax=Neocallimastix californiae TaxID=1754190 RepID=A0A1Y2CHY0_9FUNG|nr:hypothetical protein LY90DRAFT_509196 [Neocallimastix californiae]|eukprot:ORY46650.1 hypothetical protein LY90DRAFT_509196 [Neocallimastix californiae]